MENRFFNIINRKMSFSFSRVSLISNFQLLASFFLLIAMFGIHTEVRSQVDLNNYLTTAAKNNPGLKAKFGEYNASLQKVTQVGTLPNLNISFGYFISPIETRVGPQQAKISISQMFPWFGTLNSSEDVYVHRAKQNYEAFEEAKSKLYFDIKSAYFNIYFVKKGIAITEENINILNTFQQLALIKIETGKSSLVDELRVEMEINELKNQLSLLEDSKRVLEVEFHQLMNDSLTTEIITPDSLWDENLVMSKDEIRDSVITNNHLVKQIEHKIISWESDAIASRKQGGPQILLGLDYAIIGQSNNPNLGEENGKDAIMPMIGISIPLYRKKYNAMIHEATMSMEASTFEKQDKQNELTVLFERSYRDYNDANRRIELYKVQLKLADKALNILMTSYASDGENFEEVLRMERKTLGYALELDKAKADKNAAVAFINFLSGK